MAISQFLLRISMFLASSGDTMLSFLRVSEAVLNASRERSNRSLDLLASDEGEDEVVITDVCCSEVGGVRV